MDQTARTSGPLSGHACNAWGYASILRPRRGGVGLNYSCLASKMSAAISGLLRIGKILRN